jgi:p-hydroxybenzoate 3-monooxygenase
VRPDPRRRRRYLITLEYLGYVTSDRKMYALTPKVLRLGQSYMHSARLPRIVQPELHKLAYALKEASSAGVLDGADVICIAATSAGRVVSSTLQPGTRVPAYCTANGRVLLSALPQQKSTLDRQADARAAHAQHHHQPRTPAPRDRARTLAGLCHGGPGARARAAHDLRAAQELSRRRARRDERQRPRGSRQHGPAGQRLPAGLAAGASQPQDGAVVRKDSMRTQVAIVGAGPAGLLLGALLHRAGIATTIIERSSREHVLGRIRAGVLEQTTVDLLDEAGVSARMHAQGVHHEGIQLWFDGERHRIDLKALTGGKQVMVYGQTEITRDLMDAREASGDSRRSTTRSHVSVHDFDGDRPSVRYRHAGADHELQCDFIARLRRLPRRVPCQRAGAGDHGLRACLSVRMAGSAVADAAGVARADLHQPCARLLAVQHALADAQPLLPAVRARRPGRETGPTRRSGPSCAAASTRPPPRPPGHGPSLEKSIAPLRSFVAEPLRFGRLFLAGDAAHIVPPTGAKGLNLAASDVGYLAQALSAFYGDDSRSNRRYSERCLRRIWKAERFSGGSPR